MGSLLSKHASRKMLRKPSSNGQNTEPTLPPQGTEHHQPAHTAMNNIHGLAVNSQEVGSKRPRPGAQSVEQGSAPSSPVTIQNSHDNMTVVGDTEQSLSSPTWNRGSSGSYDHDQRYMILHPSTSKPLFEVRTVQKEVSLKILDRLLIDTLKMATADAAGIYQYEELFSPTSTIHAPFEFIIHNWSKIESHIEGKKGSAIESVERLLKFFKDRLTVIVEKREQIKNGSTKVFFKDLWLIYPPGVTVFQKDDGGWRAYKVEKLEGCQYERLHGLSIYAYYLDLDKSGQCLIPHLKILTVPYFSSSQAISQLEIIPKQYLRNYDDLRVRLEERGQNYEKHIGKVSYIEYRGDAWPMISSTNTVKVIIDYVTPSRHNQTADISSPISRSRCAVCLGNDIGLHSHPRVAPHDPETCIKEGMSQKYRPQTAIDTDPWWTFIPSTIWAFSLWHKTWKRIPLGSLYPVQPQEDAFKALRMETDQKRYLDSMVSAYLAHEPHGVATDAMSGKGGGFNVLLYGLPGTGKTMTAECLAEKHGCALYMVTYGELGTDPDIFEQRLCEIFLRARNWKTILLLDDADVFIEARAQGDLRRNAIVSIFLRHLEYSEVCFFMSTNQVEQLDTAIESRIHIPIHFSPLNFNDQKAVWKDAIQRLGGLGDVTDLLEFIDDWLARLDEGRYTKMNGRQIRNCVSAAHSLARAEDSTLARSHIKKVLDLGKGFARFMALYCVHKANTESLYHDGIARTHTVALAEERK